MEVLKTTIEHAWENRDQLKESRVQETIKQVIDLLDKGLLRVAEPLDNGEWKVKE